MLHPRRPNRIDLALLAAPRAAAALLALALFVACAQPVVDEIENVSTQDQWWRQLSALCGQAFAGRLVSTDEADADLVEQPMVMHVRGCTEDRLEIPFHIDTNRSRTWVLTRTGASIHLQHDHRHEDGTSDAVTFYGGTTTDPGTETSQDFPVDAYSIELFETEGLAASVTNVWTMEIVSGTRFSYILRRPGRHFRADFDLSQPVESPPAPWGW